MEAGGPKLSHSQQEVYCIFFKFSVILFKVYLNFWICWDQSARQKRILSQLRQTQVARHSSAIYSALAQPEGWAQNSSSSVLLCFQHLFLGHCQENYSFLEQFVLCGVLRCCCLRWVPLVRVRLPWGYLSVLPLAPWCFFGGKGYLFVLCIPAFPHPSSALLRVFLSALQAPIKTSWAYLGVILLFWLVSSGAAGNATGIPKGLEVWAARAAMWLSNQQVSKAQRSSRHRL